MNHGIEEYDLRLRFENLEDTKNKLKRDFESYITNRNFPLDSRWKMFITAPCELSNHSDYIYHGIDFINDGEMLEGTEHHIGKKWSNDYEERYETVYILDVVSNIEYSVKNLNEKSWSCYREPGILEKVKEQILKDNVKSFKIDW